MAHRPHAARELVIGPGQDFWPGPVLHARSNFAPTFPLLCPRSGQRTRGLYFIHDNSSLTQLPQMESVTGMNGGKHINFVVESIETM